jgi:hypothetical protein
MRVSKVTYEIVEHNGGWAYKVGDVFSETHPTHDHALSAAQNAAAEQELAGETDGIEYQDEKGRWHQEVADGEDRPETEVKDL